MGGHYNHDGIGTGFIQVKGEQEAIAMMARHMALRVYSNLLKTSYAVSLLGL